MYNNLHNFSISKHPVIIFVFFFLFILTESIYSHFCYANETENKNSEEAVLETEEQNAKKPSLESLFLRLKKDAEGNHVALETSSVTYASEEKGIKVTLIGAVHLGEKEYYDDLNKHFKDFEVVLYEVVAEEGTRPKKETSRTSAISLLQRQMSAVLGLEYQLYCVDYSPENMIHADMSPEEFKDAMKKRNDSFLQLYLRSVGYSMAIQNKAGKEGSVSSIPLRDLLFGNRSLALKRIMAEEMGNVGNSVSPFEGKNGSVILTDRNAKVIRILQKQLDEGKKNIAIFYGAAHLPDFAQQLEKDFNLTPQKPRWFTAWDLTK